MKKLLGILSVLLLTSIVQAGHISGGELFYEYIGPGAAPNTDRFKITVRLFRDCNIVPGQNIADMPGSVIIGIFRRTSLTGYSNYGNRTVARSSLNTINATREAYPCIINFPPVCYQVGVFELTEDLPREQFGYTMAFQTCCRANGILNMQGFQVTPGGNPTDGATYIGNIPGKNVLGDTGTNKSPVFDVRDTAIVCANNQFTLPFTAKDPNTQDSLSYSFCSAYDRGITSSSASIPPSDPPYNFITYVSPFSGSQPLGPNVTIDPRTGLISGVAPPQGKYVINVCIDEWRGGIKISEHRKDFILEVKDCQKAGAGLRPDYITCDGFTLSFENLNNSPLVNSWYWDFGVGASTTDTSTQERPTFTFPDSGVYLMKLVVNRGQQCSDSTIAPVRVYPGFFPEVQIDGGCIDFPFQFTDRTTTNFGIPTGWRWNFGDLTSTVDTSTLANPTWKYSDTGTKQLRFIVSNTKGCTDTIFRDVIVFSKPPLTLPFKDTLICSVDTLQLNAIGNGNFSWGPNYNIINANTATPLVFPKTTTFYKVLLNDRGCTKDDSIRVRVVDFVTLSAPLDTTICLTDSLTLRPSSDGLQFSWSPAATLDNPNKKNPIAKPTAPTTMYVVTSSIGKCSARDSLNVNTVPYPLVSAGPDVIICFEDTTQLNGSLNGTHFTWNNANTLNNPFILDPLAFPLLTTVYLLTAFDSVSGCPKPAYDTVRVTVRPKINAFAGNDTAIVVGQPLQLNASGGLLYTWTPPTGLNRDDIRNPIAVLNDNITYVLRAYTPENCESFDTINVKVFKTNPDIFVPNGFTPGKRSNNLFRPIPVGITQIDFFRVYNRWGQLVFSSNDSRGWDGTIGGKLQDTGTYVWMVQGTDFTGKRIFKKGTMVLLR